MRITLIVSGSIAAYKSAELLRELVKRGDRVRVVLTKGGEKFITSLTLQTLSGHPVTTDLFDEAREAAINHIRLADEADIVLIAPATADIIAKLACGIADDAATTVLLATKARIVVAPAMNVNMWLNPVTQENVSRLKARGVSFVEPEEGLLACGWEGTGRLAANAEILAAVGSDAPKRDLSGFRIVITAGPTREAIDPMRFVSNRSSGRMGYALARRAADRGAEVHLISGPTGMPSPVENFQNIVTADDLHATLSRTLSREAGAGISRQCLLMAAAVCDHRPESFSSDKLKQEKRAPYSLQLIPNRDIVHDISENRADIEQRSGLPLTIVGFAAESAKDAALCEYARKKLLSKGLDLIVANSIEDAAEQNTNRGWILDSNGGNEQIELATKDEVADKILDRLSRP